MPPKKDKKEPDEYVETNPFLDTGRRTIPVICPWCNKVFKLAHWKVKEGSKIAPTHGICPNCLKKVKPN